MVSYWGSAVTQARPEDVWAAWVDVARWSDGDVIESARLKGDFKEGSTIVSKVRGFPSTSLTITRVEPYRVWVDESRAPGMRMSFEHVIEPGDAGTTITERVVISGPLGGIVGSGDAAPAPGAVRGDDQTGCSPSRGVVSGIERIVVISAVAAVGAFEVWVFFVVGWLLPR